MSIEWISDLAAALDRGDDAILITVVKTDGSTPREAGASMVVTPTGSKGTIGGGHLEHSAILEARRLLGSHEESTLKRYALGASMGQCCGGVVWLLSEVVSAENAEGWRELPELVRAGAVLSRRIDSSDPGSTWSLEKIGEAHFGFALEGERWELEQAIRHQPFSIALFGAGHVGHAIALALAPLDCDIVWIDSREEIFPADLPPNIDAVESDAPEKDVPKLPPGTCFLVLTHSHDLDLKICQAILARSDFAFLGLIGSKSKRASFAKRLAERSFTADKLARITCPIGIPGLAGKSPATIAVAVAAQIAMLCEHAVEKVRHKHALH
jgi:xanthine dehydrogenase accessory factor